MPHILQNHHVLAVPDLRISVGFFVDFLGISGNARALRLGLRGEGPLRRHAGRVSGGDTTSRAGGSWLLRVSSSGRCSRLS